MSISEDGDCWRSRWHPFVSFPEIEQVVESNCCKPDESVDTVWYLHLSKFKTYKRMLSCSVSEN
jgi:hypothetical protein